jgi:hypothetical protein
MPLAGSDHGKLTARHSQGSSKGQVLFSSGNSYSTTATVATSRHPIIGATVAPEKKQVESSWIRTQQGAGTVVVRRPHVVQQ